MHRRGLTRRGSFRGSLLHNFLVLIGPYLLSQFDRSFLAIVAGDLTRELGLGPRELGAVSGAWFGAFALAQFPVGYALDHHGPRRTLAAFTLAAVAGAGVMAGAGGFGAMLVGMALVGVGCAPALMAGMLVFGRMAAPARFAGLAAALIGVGSLGNLLAAKPLALAAEAFGWRGAMLALAALHLAAAAGAFAWLRDPPPLPATSPRRSALADLAEVARSRALWPMLPLVAVSYSVVAAERGLWIAPFLRGVHGLDRGSVGDAALAMAVAMTLGAFAYGPAERLCGGAQRAVLAGGAVTAALFLALAWLPPGAPGLALAGLVGVGLCGMSYGTLMAHGRLFLPDRLLGRGVTALNFVFIGGAGLTQWLSGALIGAARANGADAAAAYAGLHGAFGLALLAGLAAYAFAPARPGPAGA